MKKTIMTMLGCLLTLLLSTSVLAANSSITEVDGNSCMGDDQTRKQTERAAMADARRNALEFAGAHISNTTQVKNFALQSDLIEAYASGEVKVLEVLLRLWVPPERDCFQISLRAEVVPDAGKTPTVEQQKELLDNPRAPLQVKLWTNQERFRHGEQMQIFLQANKDFYGRLVYTDAQQQQLQILPNPMRTDTLFRGSLVYVVPNQADSFKLTVQPPFGQEKLTLFASTQPLGELDSAPAGPVYAVADTAPQIAKKTRGLRIEKVTAAGNPAAGTKPAAAVAEFAEVAVSVTTTP